MDRQVHGARRALVGVPPPPRTLEVDGVSLAYADEGSGPPLVCLHAGGHGGGDFAPVRERFRHRCRVVTLDWPGHGRSGPDREAASARRYADLLAGVLERLGLDRPVLLGNSVGGAAAILHAARHPDAVRALVLADPGGLAPVDGPTHVVTRLMAGLFRAGGQGRRWFRPAYAAFCRVVLPTAATRAHRRRIVDAGAETAGPLEALWASFGRPDADLRPLAPAVGCPVLFAWARRDRVLAFARSRGGVERFPNATVTFFRGGHAPFLEDPEAFALALSAFLDRVGTDVSRGPSASASARASSG